MPATAVEVVNRALEQIASQATISSLSGTSPEQIAASTLYTGCVQLMLRDQEPEFARRQAALTLSGVATAPWAFSYAYPLDCMRLRQVMPPAIALSALDPQPVRWSVQDIIIASVHTRAIMTNQATAWAVYTTSNVTETEWDSIFSESVVRLLASELAMPIGGRPDFSRQKLVEAGQLMQNDFGKDS